jgi:hypothetical protein
MERAHGQPICDGPHTPCTGPRVPGAAERPDASATLTGVEPPTPPHPSTASGNNMLMRAVVELRSRGRH